MISQKTLRSLCKDRIREAEALMKAKLYDGSFYLCGYAIEIALKRRICQTLRWKDGYLQSEGEFKSLGSFKTHDLNMLLHLSGIEEKIKQTFFIDWCNVTIWKPEVRYAAGTKDAHKAREMLGTVKRLLKHV